MSMDSRMRFDRSSSTGAGNLDTRNVRKMDSFSHWAFVYGRMEDRKPYARRNAFALPLKSTCPISSTPVFKDTSRIGRLPKPLSFHCTKRRLLRRHSQCSGTSPSHDNPDSFIAG